jgi:CRP/FNR family transcriptional regulator, cyclic AMP receptor protein
MRAQKERGSGGRVAPMRELLDHCRYWPRLELAPGAVLLREGERSGRVFVLAQGCMMVHRGEVEIVLIDDPGAVFGEMSALLDVPHTTSVSATTPAVVHVVDNPTGYFGKNPELLLPIARLLARRLQNLTSYLVDLKRQYQDREDHLGMVDEVLESLTHEQGRGFIPASELPDEP